MSDDQVTKQENAPKAAPSQTAASTENKEPFLRLLKRNCTNLVRRFLAHTAVGRGLLELVGINPKLFKPMTCNDINDDVSYATGDVFNIRPGEFIGIGLRPNPDTPKSKKGATVVMAIYDLDQTGFKDTCEDEGDAKLSEKEVEELRKNRIPPISFLTRNEALQQQKLYWHLFNECPKRTFLISQLQNGIKQIEKIEEMKRHRPAWRPERDRMFLLGEDLIAEYESAADELAEIYEEEEKARAEALRNRSQTDAQPQPPAARTPAA